jgi:signal peptidase I
MHPGSDAFSAVSFETQPSTGSPQAGRLLLASGRRLGRLLLAAAAAGLLIQRFLVCFVVVHGESMSPSFHAGRVCLVQKLPGPVSRGDVVIVDDGQGRSIKRVVGLPNDSLLFRNGRVYVNGRELPEPYLDHSGPTWPVYGTRFTLDQEQVFVMGDNRGRSEDSRVYGPLRWRSILGKVEM